MRAGRSRSLVVAALAAGWVLVAQLGPPGYSVGPLRARILDGVGALLGEAGRELGWMLYMRLAVIAVLALGAIPVAGVLVLVARMVARAQLRATGADPLESLRAFAARRPRALAAALATPGALLAAASLGMLRMPWIGPDVAVNALGSALAALMAMGGSVLFGRGLLHLLAAPLDTGPADVAEGADGYAFGAVAVTRETRAAVGALGVVSLGVAALLVSMPVAALDTSANLAGLGAYVAVAVAAAVAFRRAARIALGLDGVLVQRSSRRRFFAYRDLDGARVTASGDLLLRRAGRPVLRLQLHGKDAGRRAAIVARIEAGIERARSPGAAHRLAEAATAAQLAHAARGETDYRRAGATREELWEVLEAPAADGDARTRAAAALVVGSGGEDRARLRVAAEHCAEPATRAALLRVVAAEGEAEAAAAGEADAVAARVRAAPRAAGR